MKMNPSRLLVIKDKVKNLLDDNLMLKNELKRLNNHKLAIEKELDDKNNLVDELNGKIQMLKLAKSISGEEKTPEKTEIKRKINEYIKEIDKCIALLNE